MAVVAASGLKAPSLALGDSNQIAVGDEVYAIGNPRGLEGTFSQGIVSAIRHAGSDTILQITAPISPGSSGGPILNSKGEVVGIAAATFTNGQNLNLAIPVAVLASLTGRISHKVRPLPDEGKKAEKRSIVGILGSPIARGVIGENFEWTSPFLESGEYSFSLRNQLQETVTGVQCLIVFRDARGQPIDTDGWDFEKSIAVRGLLATRVTGLRVHSSVQRLARKVEIRVLDFQFVQ